MSIKSRSRLVSAAAAFAAAAVVMTACSSSPTPAASESSDGLIDVNVVTAPIIDFLPFWVAQDQGFFTEEGLNVTGDGGGATSSAGVTPLVVSGKYQLGAGDLATIAQATEQGLDYRGFITLTHYASKEGESSIVMLGKADGPDSLADIPAGSSIGTQGVGGASQAQVEETIEQLGGDPSKYEYVNVPVESAVELIKNGSVAAAFVVEPFIAAAKADPEVKILADVGPAAMPDTPAQVLGATTAWIESAAAPRFVAAIDKAIAWIKDPANQDAVYQILSDETGIALEDVPSIVLPDWDSEIGGETTEQLLDLFKKWGTIGDDVTLEDVYVEPGN